MDSLIQTINKLQDVFSVIGDHSIDLPQIVVVGSQSSGKSSVLESLVGRALLPRGTGIVTRAPLILQMIKYTQEERKAVIKINQNEKIQYWASFLHKPDCLFFKFDEVRTEIEKRTDFLAGSNKGITHEPITLKVFTQLYNLTFVDLPGITKVPVGDQPEDIDEQIQELIFKYVSQPNSIILTIITANTDPSTSESIKIARKVDPLGERTIAVVTKLDLIDKGTLDDTKELLCGFKIPVKLGIIGVVNRSQQDINDKKSMKETLQNEKEFLRTNYPDIYKNHGNKVLADKLQNILIQNIKKTYPILLKNLQNTKQKLESELKILKTPENQIAFILELLKDISKSYIDTTCGNTKQISDEKLMGGARITRIINTEYIDKLNEIDPLLDLTDKQIGIILLNAAGTSKSSFVNEKALQIMISRQLNHLIEPSLYCVDLVRVEMAKIFYYIDTNLLDTLKRFPKLYTDVRSVLNKLLDEKLLSIKEFIRSFIETLQMCTNTTNPDFIFELIKSSTDLQDHLFVTTSTDIKYNTNEYNIDEKEKKRQLFKQLLTGLNDLDKCLETSKQVNIHRILTKCYFEFSRKNIRDFVPKRIQHKIVNAVLDEIDSSLQEHVFVPYAINMSYKDVLVEEEGIIEDRQRTMKLLEAVNKALENMVDLQCY